MDETQQRNGEVLNWLLQGANDSAQGFRQGASLARNPKLQTLFSERAEQREELAGQIASEVRSFAQPPAEGGTVIGEAHKAFTYLRDAISQHSDKGLVEELLRRERALSDKFQTAIDDTRLPSHARDVARNARPSFVQTADELTKIDQELSGAVPNGKAVSGQFDLSDEDTTFLAPPSGASVLSSGSGGTETSIERSEDTAVRIGLQAVAVATSPGGSLSVTIAAGENSAEGRDGPASIEHHLTVNQSMDVLVKAGVPLALKASATPDNAQILRMVVWSLDIREAPREIPEAAQPMSIEQAQVGAAEDFARGTT
jgi:uncharacterized protein (TIGR02284 family)